MQIVEIINKIQYNIKCVIVQFDKRSETTMKRIKNITLAGHNGSGKTSLAEALLYKAGASDRLGKTTDGTTIMDFDPEEVKRKISIGSSAAAFDYEDIKVNLIDTPGLFDFAGEMIQGISAADTVMITVSAKSGVKVGTKKAYKEAVKQNKSKMFVVTKIDDENANFYNVLTELKTVFGPTVCPVVVPVIENEKIASYVNLIEMKAYKYDDKGNTIETEMPEIEKMTYRIDGLLEAVSEAVAETDEALMEKFFEGEPFTQKELIDGIHNGMNNGIITPVVCTSAVNLSGIDMLLKEIALLIPSADESEPVEAALGDDLIQIKCTTEEPLSAFVFKTVADPFIGKVSYIKVMTGILKADSTVFNSSTGENEKIGKLYFMKGKQQTETSEATAGDIVTAVKINASTFDTLCSPERKVLFEKLSLPVPCYSMAVCSAQGDESKISTGIQRILDEDKTLKYEQNESTKEQILSGLGEQHLEVTVSKLKNKFGVDIELKEPKIAYKETIRRKVKAEGKYKKQTGGHGQYGHVWIEFEPCVSDSLIFEEKVFGGAVPKNYFPAVEKGLQESVLKGPLAGYPVVGVKATLYDGSYHPVDSSEMAFKTATIQAFKKGFMEAGPVLLEPIASVKVTVPDDYTGDVMGDLNKRRGRVLGMNPQSGGYQVIEADVPMTGMFGYCTTLRSMTGGRGSYSYEFARYEQAPADVQEKEIEKRAAEE